MTTTEQRGPAQYPGQALVTTTPIKPPIKGIMAQASRPTSPTRGQTPEARETTILQPVERRPQTQQIRQSETIKKYVANERAR